MPEPGTGSGQAEGPAQRAHPGSDQGANSGPAQSAQPGSGQPSEQPRSPGSDTVSVTIDGRHVVARKGEMLIAAAERAGVFIPRFCYHPRMEPVGMCRMCLVEVKGPRGFSLQPSCYLAVSDGQEVVTTSPKVKKAQDGVLEFLLVNHPLDCPVCDKGGECPLQDQTLSYGPGESRFVEEKRHWAKPVPISDLVLLDRERCIQCARCTRFADEIAGDPLIDFFSRGDRIEVSIFEGKPFKSYFSANIVQICPVGALTAAPYRFRARPWDLDQVESTCTMCALGCRMVVQSSGDRVTRQLGMDTDPVNQSWLCDKGRFAYEALEHDTRLTAPLVRKDGELVETSWSEALAAAARGLEEARARGSASGVGFIGGARCTNEGAYAWSKLAKSVIGTDSVDAQVADGLPAEVLLGLPRATIDEACDADLLVLASGDLREELPVLFLRIRRAILDGRTRLIECSPYGTSLSPLAEVSLRPRPGAIVELMDAILADDRASDHGHAADASSGVAAGGAAGGGAGASGHLGAGGGAPASQIEAARRLISEVSSSEPHGRVVVVIGRSSLAEDGRILAEAARRLAQALPDARFLPALRRGNVMGALDMGMAPGVLPGRVSLDAGRAWYEAKWGKVPAKRGLDALGMLRSAAAGELDALVLVGADPLGDFPDAGLAKQAIDRASFLVAVDAFRTQGVECADVVLPVAAFQERSGTTTNIEGRVTRLAPKVTVPVLAWPDWMVAVELAGELGADLGMGSLDEVTAEIARVAATYERCTPEALAEPGSRDGIVVPNGPRDVLLPLDPIAVPGIESVERQGAPLRSGTASDIGGSDTDAGSGPPGSGVSRSEAVPGSDDTSASGAGLQAPPVLGVPAEPLDVHVPPTDAYSLRLVAPRRLYDSGVVMSRSPALSPLAEHLVARANPADLAHLGLASGDLVRLRSATGSLELEALPDPGVREGSVVVPFHSAAGEPGVRSLIDASVAVTEVRMETTS